VTMKSDQWKILPVGYYHDVELNAGARDASSTSAITVTLTSSSKAVCHQHTDVCIRQLCYCSVKLFKFTGPGLWLPARPVWINKAVIAMFELVWQYLCGKTGYFFNVCVCDVFVCVCISPGRHVLQLHPLGCSTILASQTFLGCISK